MTSESSQLNNYLNLYESYLFLLVLYKLVFVNIFLNLFARRMGNTPCKTELRRKDIQFLEENTELDEAEIRVNEFFNLQT